MFAHFHFLSILEFLLQQLFLLLNLFFLVAKFQNCDAHFLKCFYFLHFIQNDFLIHDNLKYLVILFLSFKSKACHLPPMFSIYVIDYIYYLSILRNQFNFHLHLYSNHLTMMDLKFCLKQEILAISILIQYRFLFYSL